MTEVTIPLHAIKGRGTATRLAHRFEKDTRAAYDDGWGTLEESAADQAAIPTEVVFEEQSAVPLALEGQIALGGARLAPGDYNAHIEKYAALRLSDGTTIFKRIGASLRSPLSHVRQFEPIGGLGVAEVLAVGKSEQGFAIVESGVLVLGVLYHG